MHFTILHRAMHGHVLIADALKIYFGTLADSGSTDAKKQLVEGSLKYKQGQEG